MPQLKINKNAIQFFEINGFKKLPSHPFNQIMNFWCYMSHKTVSKTVSGLYNCTLPQFC